MTKTRKILDTMWSLLGERTLLLITHRLIDMEKMDQIFVMQKGKIAETGTHTELLQQKGLYARMFEFQNELIRDL